MDGSSKQGAQVHTGHWIRAVCSREEVSKPQLEVQAGGMGLAYVLGTQLVLKAARPEMARGVSTDRDQDQAGG